MHAFRNLFLFTLSGISLYLMFTIVRSQKEHRIIDDLQVPDATTVRPDSIRNSIALNQLVYDIAMLKSLEGDVVGFEGRRSTRPGYADLLQLWADTAQLVKLTDHGSPVVRVTAFGALKAREYPGLKAIFEKHIYDDQTYALHSGCETGPRPVNVDFFYCISPVLTAAEKESFREKLLKKYEGTYLETMFRFL